MECIVTNWDVNEDFSTFLWLVGDITYKVLWHLDEDTIAQEYHFTDGEIYLRWSKELEAIWRTLSERRSEDVEDEAYFQNNEMNGPTGDVYLPAYWDDYRRVNPEQDHILMLAVDEWIRALSVDSEYERTPF